MTTLNRRTLMASCAALALTPALPFRPAWGEEAVRGGTLIAAADTEPRNLNPAMVASNGVFYVASKVVEPLAEMDYETGLKPLLATAWEGSEDGLSFTVTLREGVTWHDGAPFSSADVAFSAMNVWKPLQNLGRVVFANLASVETPDAQTARFVFSEPTPAQLIENAMPALTAVLPKHLYEGTEIAENPYNLKPVGTGPFVFAEHRPGEFYRLTRNENYWGEGLPYLDEILYRVMPDAGAKAAGLETGDLDVTAFSAVPLSELARLDALPDVTVIPGGYEGITYNITVEINHRRQELSDPRVRQAIAHAIDKDLIVDLVFLGYAKAATGPIPASAEDFYTSDVPAYPYDPDKAEALLDEAGFPRGEGDMRFKVRLRPAPWFEQTRAVGDVVRQALRRIGIDVEVVTADPGGHIRGVYTDHDFDLAIGSPVWRNDPAISTTILFKGGLPAGVPFANQYGYQSDKMDALIDKAATTVDGAERVSLYKDFQRLALTDLPIIHLIEFTFITVARDRVKGVANNPRWATSNWADTWLEG